MHLASLILLELLVRIELTSAGYKAAVLPLNYNSKGKDKGSRLRDNKLIPDQFYPLAFRYLSLKFVREEGIEPPPLRSKRSMHGHYTTP